MKGTGPKELKCEEVLGMLSDRTPRTFVFDEKYELVFSLAEIGGPTQPTCLAMETSGTHTDPKKQNWQKQECTGAEGIRV